MIHVALAALLLAPPQDFPPAPAPTPGTGSQPTEPPRVTFAGVAVQVNDTIITFEALDTQMRRQIEARSLSTDEERLALRDTVLREAVDDELATQAGFDLGFDKRLVEEQVKAFYDRKKDELGLIGASQFLAEQGADPEGARNSVRNSLYREVWEQSTVGVAPGAGGRRWRDRTIRPGELWGIYERERTLLPDTVQLQYLVVLAAAAGGAADAERVCAELRAEVEGGADIGQLVGDFGAELRDTLGVAAPQPANAIAQNELRAWAERAPAGSLSPVLPYASPKRPDELAGYQIVRMLERRAPPSPPPFVDPGLQNRLLTQIRQYRDQELISDARRRLQEHAHLWTYFDREPRRW